MNWIRKDLRLAIYLRDGMACQWCGSTLEDGIVLTLDHVIPWSKWGSNRPENLVTCCRKCNSSRNDRHVDDFAAGVSGYLGVSAEEILENIRQKLAEKISPFRAEARDIMARRATWALALAHAGGNS